MNRVCFNVIYCCSLKLAFGEVSLHNEIASIWENKCQLVRFLRYIKHIPVSQSETGYRGHPVTMSRSKQDSVTFFKTMSVITSIQLNKVQFCRVPSLQIWGESLPSDQSNSIFAQKYLPHRHQAFCQ